ncbi:hypothetical protein BST61_g2098 [Cercospora zeina]
MRRRNPFSTDQRAPYAMSYDDVPVPSRDSPTAMAQPVLTSRPENQLASQMPAARSLLPSRPCALASPLPAARSISEATPSPEASPLPEPSPRSEILPLSRVSLMPAALPTQPAFGAAATKVFATPELVDEIFRHYEAGDIQAHNHVATLPVMLKMQLINKAMRKVTIRSPYFSRLIFLTEQPGVVRPWFVQGWNSPVNPIVTHGQSKLRNCIFPFVQLGWDMASLHLLLRLKYDMHLEDGKTSLAQHYKGISESPARHQHGTWQWMRVHYLRNLDVVVRVRVVRRKSEGSSELGSHEIPLAGDATLGTVVARSKDLVTWIEGVAMEGHDLENIGEEWIAN